MAVCRRHTAPGINNICCDMLTKGYVLLSWRQDGFCQEGYNARRRGVEGVRVESVSARVCRVSGCGGREVGVCGRENESVRVRVD